ncbi:serine dehydratase beta chain, partial [Blastomonas sp.]|uniref:serine dehydratase beta chain n=1 Tax=Blastomonas sp. TaxID=1909299 RepID=UPI0035948C4F
MVASVFDLFKIGIGPSSSHTMGPMVAANRFVARLTDARHLAQVVRIETRLYGSLALTGKGHASDRAILLGLSGQEPRSCDPDSADRLVETIRAERVLRLAGHQIIGFDESADLLFLQRERLDYHSNAMTFTAFAADGSVIDQRNFFSVGGGAVVDQDETGANAPAGDGLWDPPHVFCSGADLLRIASDTGLSIAEITRANELAAHSTDALSAGLAEIADAMSACIERGIRNGGELPGGLRVKRRAPLIMAHLMARQERMLSDPLTVIDWVNLWALAVNEENAAGGKVVTAPTNGA